MHLDQARILGAQKPAVVVKSIHNHEKMRIKWEVENHEKNNLDG